MKKQAERYYLKRYRDKDKKRISQYKMIMYFAVILIFILTTILFILNMEDNKNVHVEENIISEEENKIDVNSMKEYSFSEWNASCERSMVIVNFHNHVPENWKIDIQSYGNYQVDNEMLNNLDNMIKKANQDGIKLWISSAYRSNSKQKKLYDQEVKSYVDKGETNVNAQAQAANSVAVPGTSEHELGLAVDLNNVNEDFKNTPAYEWLCKNADDFGFIQRYPDNKQEQTGIIYEPWHYRYVGVQNAHNIKASGLCMEEYVIQKINENK